MSHTTPRPKKGRPKEPRPPEKGGHTNLIRAWTEEELEDILEEEMPNDDADANAK